MSPQTKTNSGIRAIAAVAFVAAGIAFAAFRVREATTLPETPTSAKTNGDTTGTAAAQFPTSPMANMPPEQRAAMRKEMREKLNLSDEQKAKIEALEKDGEMSPFQIMRILTPAQRQQMHKQMQSRGREFVNTMGKDLPPEERQKLEQKFEQRHRQIGDSLSKGELPNGLP